MWVAEDQHPSRVKHDPEGPPLPDLETGVSGAPFAPPRVFGLLRFRPRSTGSLSTGPGVGKRTHTESRKGRWDRGVRGSTRETGTETHN